MTSISAAKLRQNIYKILNDVNENSEPITITNTKGRNAMIISEDDWKAIQETIHLNSIPGMAEPFEKAARLPLKTVSQKLKQVGKSSA